MKFLELCRRIYLEEAAQDLVEYALIGALVALTAIASIRSVGTAVRNTFSALGSELTGDI
jgi:pilus assembly protein Flp/PilA